MSNFYLTLPSNSSVKYFPDNTLTRFTTKLHSAISLIGDWEVGLSEIIFPKTWYNVERASLTNPAHVTITGLQSDNKPLYTSQVRLTPGHYSTIEKLIEEINNNIARNFRHQISFEPNDKAVKSRLITDIPDLRYNVVNRKINVYLPASMSIRFSESLAYTFGLVETRQNPIINSSTTDVMMVKGHRTSDIAQGYHALYIYCDVLESVPVGDTQAPLLRIVDTEGEHGSIIHKCYEKARYLPLQKKHFDSLEIDIRTDAGLPVPFEHGSLVITLHFRQRKHAYFLG